MKAVRARVECRAGRRGGGGERGEGEGRVPGGGERGGGTVRGEGWVPGGREGAGGGGARADTGFRERGG